VSRATTIYVFRCGVTALYALTADRTGQRLPSQICGEADWHFERAVTLQSRSDSAERESTKATLDAIAKHGFYLIHAAIHNLPGENAVGSPGEVVATSQGFAEA
jgi:hypothetical protein